MERLERIRGCLLAGAAGDALGYAVEFLEEDALLERFGTQGVREMRPVEGVFQISDDTQMTLFIAEGLLNALRWGEDAPYAMWQSCLDWHTTQYAGVQPGIHHAHSRLAHRPEMCHQRAPGVTCLSALSMGRMGTPEQAINQSKGCGGVMRAAPAGMLRVMTQDEDAYLLQGAAAAAITHGHPLGWLPGAMLAELVGAALDGRYPTLWDASMETLRRMERRWGRVQYFDDFDRLISRAMDLSKTDMPAPEAVRALGKGWVGEEALAIALYCSLRFFDDMEECLCAAVSHGGDSDSTGAIAGNLLGAWRGAGVIPPRYLESLEARELIEEMALEVAQAGGSHAAHG